MRSTILFSSISRAAMGFVLVVILCLVVGHAIPVAAAQSEFRAIGPTEPVKLPPRQKGAVKVTFDLVPTSMSFDLPAFPCMVTENNIKYSNFWAETYDPRHWHYGGGLASFEPLMDRRNRYARMWIEHQSDARIVVRVRGALCNREEGIARPDIPSGSPYGKGEWVDEWFYIYPDGVHVRHVKIYTGMAYRSRPFGFDREPPATVHEFMESAVIGERGTVPTDLIEIEALTLIKMVGGHCETLIPGGETGKISYKPYPVEGFGEFRDANIMVVNTKSKFKPFTIGLPYGVRIQPYMPEDDLPHVFQTWGNTSALGHMLNFWHYRRTDNTLEQIYLQGMTDAEDQAKELVPLATSWIIPPRLQMEVLKPSYTVDTYDPAQRAYVLQCDVEGPSEIEFELEMEEDFSDVPQAIVNPAILIKDWGDSGVELKVDGEPVERGKDFRVGYEETHTGKDLVIWLKMKTSETVEFSISPK
jgi:hypothetical protein